MAHRKPPHLYKYVPAARIDILQNARIRFTPPAAFNDPFDVLPGLQRAVFASEVDRFDLHAEERFDEYMREGFRDDKKQVEAIRDDVGVLSLTAEPGNLLMWSHYADHHRGFLIEFAATHPFFHQRLSKDDEFHHVRRVTYARDRPGTRVDSFRAARILLTKSIEWRYEREWRMLVDFTRFAHEVVKTGTQAIRVVPLPPECITGVVLGARMPEETREQVCSVITADPRYTHVAVCGSELDSTAYRVSFHRGQPHHERAGELFKQALRFRGRDTATGDIKSSHPAALLRLVEEAIAELNRALRYWRSCSDYWLARAGCHQLLGRFEAAIDDFNEALKVAPQSAAPNLHLLRGHLLAQLGRYDEAKRDFERAADGEVDGQLLEALKQALGRQAATARRNAGSTSRGKPRRRRRRTT